MIIRKATPDCQGYIAKTWVASVLDGPHVFIDDDARPALNREIDRLLDDKLTRILVACEDADQSRILGFVVYAGRTLLYVCVRAHERRNGIATALLREAGFMDKAKPLLYVYDGPATKWALKHRPDAVKISLQEHLA